MAAVSGIRECAKIEGLSLDQNLGGLLLPGGRERGLMNEAYTRE